jgi:chromosome segregation ATPase
MFGSYLYWITTAALVLTLFVSLMRRQTIRELTEARKKLLDERAEREQLRAELVHVRSTAEKDLAASKKQTNEAKNASIELEQRTSTLEKERDELRVELAQVRAELAVRTAAEESAKKKIAELEQGIEAGRSGARANEDKLGDLSRDVQAARSKVEALEKKLDGETRLRKVAEDERNAAKATMTTLESKHREAERAKAALADAHAKEVQTMRDGSTALEAELVRTKEVVTKVQEELAAERSKVQTPVSSVGDVLAALDADTILNRGQKETIRMTYNQFTAKRRAQ